ncbi:hypothetical protein [Saccharothrix coeruleofusca]|uniref:Uncharacterized protein n=1 Tax=Saccharothrix coeruleofusca TaxID=33919 RepID=A0A918AMH0_9PSEU|nr:hypothetical protein [Saccharothrix coeruleofusca]GGP52758.1 hypothetical protein GCM10010185_26090 [Saccharothrix coeruleofusca]
MHRQGDIDYVTREGLARAIAGSFRSGIEKIAPGQRDFDIASEVYDQWRETVRVRKDGSPRVGGGTGLLLPVRAYGASAGGDAGSRSGWPTGFASASRCCRRSSRTSRSATRACGSCWWPRSAPLDGVFATAVAPTSGWALAPISAIATIRSSRWEWACVEVLRPTGVRAEELVELAHTGIRQYERPNGEMIALLVIAPSKTDRERVIPMPAELFHVIATIVLRQTAHDPIPLVPRYDGHDRKWAAPMPHLFQR